MAQRYGGEFSPNGSKDQSSGAAPVASRPFAGRRPARVSVFARLLFLAPLPLLAAGLGEIMRGNPFAALLELGGFAIFMLAAWLLNEGLRAEAAYNDRKVSRAPGLPRKIIAAALLALGVFLVQGIGGEQILTGIVFAAIAGAAQLFAFGLDPMRAKGIEGLDPHATDRVARAIETAEEHVAAIRSAAKRTRDREVIDRVERLSTAARDVFRTVEEDPRDLSRARKFLSVYLKGARDATTKFSDIQLRSPSPDARGEYLQLLTDLEASFTKHKADLLADNRTDLDVEIEVLRERLQQEGLNA